MFRLALEAVSLCLKYTHTASSRIIINLPENLFEINYARAAVWCFVVISSFHRPQTNRPLNKSLCQAIRFNVLPVCWAVEEISKHTPHTHYSLGFVSLLISTLRYG